MFVNQEKGLESLTYMCVDILNGCYRYLSVIASFNRIFKIVKILNCWTLNKTCITIKKNHYKYVILMCF